MIYLDNAATTELDPAALEAMMPYLKTEYGNAGSMYELGRKARTAVETAREQVARFLNASPEQIIFTSSGSEANNLAILGLKDHLLSIGKTEIVTTPVEHMSVLNPINELCIKHGFHSHFLPTFSDKLLRTVDFNSAINENTGLVSVMYSNNETGLVSPIKKVGKICSQKGILFHTDCVQAAGCYDLDVKKINCDTLSISAHKIHAPKGVGALYVKNKDFYSPVIFGGSGQEFGLRAGTENVAGIVGFGYMCELIGEVFKSHSEYLSSLKNMFYNELKKELAACELGDIMYLNASHDKSSGKTLNLRCNGIDGQTLLLLLDKAGVCVSSGSACSGSETTASHVLLAMGISEEDAANSIRISISASNNEDEIVSAAHILANCVKELHSVQD